MRQLIVRRSRPGRHFALLAALALHASLAAAQPTASRRPLAIEDYYRLLTVGPPELSPDGRWVAFAVSRRIETTNGDTTQVWLVPTDGSASARRVSPEELDAGPPGWTEAGQLRFAAAGRLWLLDPDAPETVIDGGVAGRGSGRGGGGGGATPAVLTSPNGEWTAIVRDVPPATRARTNASDFERRHEERFRGVQFDWLNFQRDGAPFPAPNSADPAVNPPQEIFIALARGGPEQAATNLGLRPGGTQWNHDGTALLFTADSSYRDELTYGSTQIWMASLDAPPRRLTSDDRHNHTGATYSPDGRWILYTRQLTTDAVIAEKLSHGGPRDLAVIPASGGTERLLTSEWDFLPGGARWSPDGRYVYFTGGVGGTTHLFRVSPVGGPVEQVTKGERRIGGLSFDRGMTKMAFTVGRIEGPPEIHVANIDGTNERQLTRIHDSFTGEVALRSAVRMQFRSRDGTPVEGWLIAPYGYDPNAGPYPLIVNNHGGPHSAVGYSFDFKNQFFAANGYFVLSVNFRGSTGYGEEFLWGTWGAWGDKDGEDVMAGIDHVIASYPVDRSRVATIGHSYGGFMSNWLIVQYPDRFAAAAVGAGIVNWVSDYGTADIARTKETEFYGTPWEERAREIMIRQSPLTYANRARAATLFIHGELDQRVPYSEAEQMFVALKKNGVPTRMIQYAGMPHGISGSWNNVHRMLNELRWIDQYLTAGLGIQ